ncbi:uncharacterized protein LOC125207680 [Salvia hispanica]|uniref:uncharacterized protein LOC125207680 n=1 Tax=Salvia hispanica TaxID=49212 RepID=UPI002008FA2A|nr:uncharacterized protein LOC125207680 [Salvia hispanica]
MAKSTTAALSLLLPAPRRSKIRPPPPPDRIGKTRFSRTTAAAAVRCCCIEFGVAEAMREAQPYFVAHRGSTFVVVLAAQIVDGPHLPSILRGTHKYSSGA